MTNGILSSWQFYTLADAYAPRPPLEYVVDGIFLRSSLNVVFGAPGTLKSMLIADVCACVASGTPWLSGLLDTGRNVKTTQCNVLWIDFDNGKRRTHERLDAIGKAYKLPESTPIIYTSMVMPWLDVSRTDMVLGIIDILTDMSIGLLVIDNLGVVSGNTDENTIEMIRVMGNLRLIAERTNACVIVIHHQRKMLGSKDGSRNGDSLRGHSSIEASLDLALRVLREEHSDSIIVQATKARGMDIKPFGALFYYEHKPGTVELEVARFYGLDENAGASDKAIIDAVFEALEGAPTGTLKQSEIVKKVKEEVEDVGQNRIRAMLARMEANKDIISKTSSGKSHAKLYSMPPVPTQASMPFDDDAGP